MKKIILVVGAFLVAVLVVIILLIHQVWAQISFNKPSFIFDPHNEVATRFEGHKPFTILLLGYGGGNHDGAYLTDSILVVRIDPSTKKISLLSIPRDIWLSLPTSVNGSSYWKINDAYPIGLNDTDFPEKDPQFRGKTGGGKMAQYAVEEVTGIHIDRFVALDFTGFAKTIDTVGGVDVNVKTAFTDEEYPVDGKENDTCGYTGEDFIIHEQMAGTSPVTAFPCRYEMIHFYAGWQHMDGTRALQYVRSRHSVEDGTDFGRAQRQQNVLLAFKQKVSSPAFIPRAIPFLLSLQNDVKTDLSLSEVQSLLSQEAQVKTYTIQNIALTDANILQDSTSDTGGSILIPSGGIDDWADVQAWVRQQLEQ